MPGYRPILKLLLLLLFTAGGLLSAFTEQPGKPENNRFTPVVLTPEASLDEPMVFEVRQDGSVYIAERKGGFKKYDPATQTVNLLATLPVFTENEQGLVGFTMDPNFATNHWIYLYYAHPTESKFRLTRWKLVDDELVENSQQLLLEVPADREATSHTGGGMTWDAKGNLYITIGNNSGNSYFSQTDQRPGRRTWDDQRGAANTNDLRGGILRIHPEPDGTAGEARYTIPEGNLFPKGTPKTRPELYIKGTRNAWRPSLDSKTGWLYWGEIGPDADVDTENAPRGYDEFNQARQPGFFGWPYFVGDNYAYPMYDYATNQPGPKQDPNKAINRSPNNTGLNELPPAQPALVYYPYAFSEKFPLVGSSSRCAIGGPIYHRSDFKAPKRPFPAYYEGKWLAADLSRFWIMAIALDADGHYQSMERFAPDYHPRQPIDLKFGPDGDLYVLEYGGNTAKSPVEARLVRIEYNAGNRKPVVQVGASQRGGALPLRVTLSSAGTKDYDGDALKYQWKVTSSGGSAPRVFATANPVVDFDKAGVYVATLTVTDSKGAKNTNSLRIVAGNEPPVVTLKLSGNRDFFFADQPVDYQVEVRDQEDGSLADGAITPAQVAVSIDYASEGFDPADLDLPRVDASTQYAVARALIGKSDCSNCHNATTKVVGPAYAQIATKYQADPEALDRVTRKVRSGGAGAWGEASMPAHPSLSEHDARTMVKYILNINNQAVSTRPVSGTYTTQIPAGDNGKGTYILRAAYTDKATKVPAQTSASTVVLRSPQLIPTDADTIEGGAVRDQLDDYTFLTTKPNSSIGFRKVDMTAIKQVELRPNWHLYDIYVGGRVEIRLDSPTGELLGETEVKAEQFNIKRMPGGADAFWGRPPVNDRNAKTIPSKVAIKETSGVHDLYFVFKNDKATGKDSLFPLAGIWFSNEAK